MVGWAPRWMRLAVAGEIMETNRGCCFTTKITRTLFEHPVLRIPVCRLLQGCSKAEPAGKGSQVQCAVLSALWLLGWLNSLGLVKIGCTPKRWCSFWFFLNEKACQGVFLPTKDDPIVAPCVSHISSSVLLVRRPTRGSTQEFPLIEATGFGP